MHVLKQIMIGVLLMLLGMHGEPRAADKVLDTKLQYWLRPQTWVRDSSHPAISLGTAGEFDDMHLFAPCVRLDDGQYRLWYCGSRGNVANRVFGLGLALSPDGREFHKINDNPVLEFGDGKHSILTPTVLREGGKWRMWYACRTKPPFNHKYFAIGSATWSESAPDFQTRLETIHRGYDGQTCWVHPRAGIVPGKTPAVVLTMQKLQLTGSDVFFALNEMRTDDLGKSWSEPLEHRRTLGRRTEPDGTIVATCDFWPKWHAASGTLLGIGHTVRYRDEKVVSDRERKTSYSIYDPQQRAWSDWSTLEMPDSEKYYNSGAGCAQRVDLPNGDILLPIYFKGRGQERYRSTVLRCRFDGTRLSVVESGSEHTVAIERGLFEPSLTKFGDRYFLSLRNDQAGYVATSDDGLHFTEPQPWRWDDGSELGNYNTQQHWVAHSQGLFLVYTRKGAKNDHVFRHRAPLFIAQVDPTTLRVIRRTERVLVPERGARLGNFGVTEINESETWVTVAEWMQAWPPKIVIPPDNRYGADNSVYVARILWDEPNLDWNRH